MQTKLTTPQLRQLVDKLISDRTLDPDTNLPGMHLIPTVYDCDGPSDTIVLAYQTQPWMRNPMGVVHGGVVAILLDNAMGTNSTCHCGIPTPTISMTVNFARPIPLNTTVVVRTRLTRMGRTTAYLTGEIFLPDDPDTVLATGTGVYYTAVANAKRSEAQ